LLITPCREVVVRIPSGATLQ